MDGLLQDIRYALRTLAKTPGFTLVVTLTLRLGIGANTAIFSLLDQVLLRQLPVKNPHELVQLDGPGPFSGHTCNNRTFSYPMYRDFRDRNEVMSGVLAGLSAAFGLLATLLAAVGLYGVMSYTVARRTREIGIRMALGAARGTVIGLVLPDVMLLAGVGLVVGATGAYALARVARTQLFGLSPGDPPTVALALAGLALVTIAAGYLPARRASQIDPILALRYE